MREFYAQRVNLLVCSTIIETGIDVPTANTIIIERADRFGLAQLHQLRAGSVARTTRPTRICSRRPRTRFRRRRRSGSRRSR